MSRIIRPTDCALALCGLLALIVLALGAELQAATTTYAATTIGPYKSTDGSTWQPVKVTVSSPLLQGIPNVGAIAVDPLNSRNIYFIGRVTGTSGFFKSTDAGQTWSAVLIPGLSVGSNQGSSQWLVIDPVATNVLYISCGKTFRSTDSGATWNSITALDTFGGLPGIGGIAIDPKNSGVLYVSSFTGGVAKSTDFGVTFQTLIKQLFGSSPTTGGIFVDPLNTQRLYVARTSGQGCFVQNVAKDCNLFTSADGGKTWQPVATPGSARFVDFDRTNGDIYVGAYETGVGSTVLKSSDQGVTWTPLVKGVGGLSDGPAVSVDPGASGNVYALGDTIGGGGNFKKTTDGGATWTPVTVPPYCTVNGLFTAACPSGVGNVTPQVYALAYAVPPAGGGFVCTNTTQPLITSIDSASAYGGYPYFASGSWLEIKGANLADPSDPRLTASTNPGQWTASDFSGANAPTLLDGVGVSINGKPAYVWYLSPGQLNVQAPEDSTIGNVSITVTNCKPTSPAFSFARHALAPGLLAPAGFNIGGTQYMAATFASDGAYVLNTAAGAVLGINSRPAKPGDVIIAYGIGFGDVAPSILPGLVVGQSNTLTSPVTISFGTAPATLSYSGLAGNFVGLYEFYITVPAGLANGDYQINVSQSGTTVPQTMYLSVHN